MGKISLVHRPKLVFSARFVMVCAMKLILMFAIYANENGRINVFKSDFFSGCNFHNYIVFLLIFKYYSIRKIGTLREDS